MSAAGEGGLSVGGFLPVTFKADVQYMLHIIRVGVKNLEGNSSTSISSAVS